MKNVFLSNLTHPFPQQLNLVVCNTFFLKFQGLMLAKTINPYQGILLVEKQVTRIGSSIHTFFMLFDICTVWLDGEYQVVDKVIALRWHPYYLPGKPARYIIETHPDHFQQFMMGDRIQIEYA